MSISLYFFGEGGRSLLDKMYTRNVLRNYVFSKGAINKSFILYLLGRSLMLALFLQHIATKFLHQLRDEC